MLRCERIPLMDTCSIKGDVKENTSPSTGQRGDFLGIQPLLATRDAWFWCPAQRSCLVLFPLCSCIFTVATMPSGF
jgi:hypothetical protein